MSARGHFFSPCMLHFFSPGVLGRGQVFRVTCFTLKCLFQEFWEGTSVLGHLFQHKMFVPGILGGDEYFWSGQFCFSSYSTAKGSMAAGVGFDDWSVSRFLNNVKLKHHGQDHLVPPYLE